MTAKTTDLMNETVKIIEAPIYPEKPVKIVYEGPSATREEAIKKWFEILQNLKQ